jgi:hypothetical protein
MTAAMLLFVRFFRKIPLRRTSNLNGERGANDVRAQSSRWRREAPYNKYNNPANVGNLSTCLQMNEGGMNDYHVDAGDLNGDNKPDLNLRATTEWPSNRLQHGATNALGTRHLGSEPDPTPFSWSRAATTALRAIVLVVGSERRTEFGDATLQAIYERRPSVDCNRRAKIYHQPGRRCESAHSRCLREEAQQASGGWKGAVGILTRATDFDRTRSTSRPSISTTTATRTSSSDVAGGQRRRCTSIRCCSPAHGRVCSGETARRRRGPCSNASPRRQAARACLSSLNPVRETAASGRPRA